MKYILLGVDALGSAHPIFKCDDAERLVNAATQASINSTSGDYTKLLVVEVLTTIPCKEPLDREKH